MKKSLILCILFIQGCSYSIKEKQTTLLKTFSNTQEWGKSELYFLHSWKPKYVSTGFQKFKSEKFPQPNSLEIKKEINTLLFYQKNRTRAKEKIITRQKHLCGFVIGKYRIGLNLKSDELILDAYFDSRIWGFYLKKYFDRVRPSHLDSRIKPSIENPPHAAYPSNHSFQAHLIAHILSEISKENKVQYFTDAKSIAKNREIAGVHYPSDSLFGEKLARYFFKKIKENKNFLKKLDDIKRIWPKVKLSQNYWSESEYKRCLNITSKYAINNNIWPD